MNPWCRAFSGVSKASIATADFFVDTRWVASDFVYTCTIMFSDETMAALAALADGMAPGSIFASVSADFTLGKNGPQY